MSEAKSNAEIPQADIPSAYDIPLEDIMPINARLWSEHKWLEYFERLRAEDPVHFNYTDIAGRFWSLTKYARRRLGYHHLYCPRPTSA